MRQPPSSGRAWPTAEPSETATPIEKDNAAMPSGSTRGGSVRAASSL